MSIKTEIADPTSQQAKALNERIRSALIEHGFAHVGIAPAVSPTGVANFEKWLELGFAGEMEYLKTRRDAYRTPSGVLEGCRSVVAMAFPYFTTDPAEPRTGQGRISRYAWGEVDYHDLIHTRLKQIRKSLNREFPNVSFRGVVDTAPLLERDFARLAGMGWQAKNTMLIRPGVGSWFFLAFLLTDQALEADTPFEKDHCGTCTACLEACPTDAFVQPHQLDATKCISYLTIELHQPIPQELRSGIGDWLFGCDVCQEVCPWNRFASGSSDSEFEPRPDHNPIDLIELLAIDDDQFRTRFRKTPLWRTKRAGLLRNAAIVLGNQKCLEAVSALLNASHDPETVIREAVVWALGEIVKDNPKAFYAREQILSRLVSMQTQETDSLTCESLETAISNCESAKPR